MPQLQHPFPIPKPLHEALGEQQSLASLTAVALTVLIAALSWFLLSPTPEGLAFWRQALALVLFLDIAAGAAANFTPGTNQYYAERPRHRWGFIALHFHLPAIGALLAAPMAAYWAIWAYTILTASLVNLLHRNPLQPLLGGTVICLGLLTIPVLQLDPFSQLVGLMFLLKVSYSFAVTHRI